MSMEKKTRSASYQAIFAELSCSNDILEAFSNQDSIYNRLNPWAYDERLVDLEDALRKELWRVIEASLTTRQKEVIRLAASGMTQMEIAKKLNVNQSSITKSINGNVDYKNGKKSYGGSKRKLLKIIERDVKIQELIAEINELRQEKW
jgi:DNA-binding CsgD family transcriptional regulator